MAGSLHFCEAICQGRPSLLAGLAQNCLYSEKTHHKQISVGPSSGSRLPQLVEESQQCLCRDSVCSTSSLYHCNDRCTSSGLGAVLGDPHCPGQMICPRDMTTHQPPQTEGSQECLYPLPACRQVKSKKILTDNRACMFYINC